MSNLVFLSFTARKTKEAPLYTWCDSSTWDPQPIPFTGTPGPSSEAAELQSAEPADFVSLFMTDELLEKILYNTNRHAQRTIVASEPLSPHSRLRRWQPVDLLELKNFLGLLLLTGKFLSPVE